MKVTGEVVSISNKAIAPPGKRPFKVHYVELDNGKVINVGYKQPFEVGQSISVDCEMAYGELKMGAPASPSSSGTSGASAHKSGGYSSGRNDKFPVPISHGDFSIIRQNALTNAVNLVTNEGSELAGDELVEEIIRIAYKFADFSSGQREVKLEKKLASKVMTRDDA